MFRPSRDRRGPDPQLNWKMALFVVGAAAGAVGMALDNTIIVGGAVAILGIAIVLRFLGRRQENGAEVDDGAP